MSISTHFGEAGRWAQAHFGAVALGDVRRSRRVVTLAAGWARQPGATIPQVSQGQAYASKAAYTLLGQPQATPDALQAPHLTQNSKERRPAGRRFLKIWVRTSQHPGGAFLFFEEVRWRRRSRLNAGLV